MRGGCGLSGHQRCTSSAPPAPRVLDAQGPPRRWATPEPARPGQLRGWRPVREPGTRGLRQVQRPGRGGCRPWPAAQQARPLPPIQAATCTRKELACFKNKRLNETRIGFRQIHSYDGDSTGGRGGENHLRVAKPGVSPTLRETFHFAPIRSAARPRSASWVVFAARGPWVQRALGYSLLPRPLLLGILMWGGVLDSPGSDPSLPGS